MYDLFKNSEWNERLSREGYVRFNLLSVEEVEQLYRLYADNTRNHQFEGFHASLFHPDPEYRRKIDQGIRESVSRALHDIINERYYLLYANFMVKEKGAVSVMPLHQDWAYVDESRADSYAVWIPLADLNEGNGAFSVIPFSHHAGNYYRGPGMVCAFKEIDQDAMKELGIPLYLKAGEAVVWHHRLAHYSPPNLSDKPRIAATAIIVPEGEDIFHYIQESFHSPVTQYKVDRDFYMNYKLSEKPAAPVVRSFDHEVRTLSKLDLENFEEVKNME